jgi:hypothetical protein
MTNVEMQTLVDDASIFTEVSGTKREMCLCTISINVLVIRCPTHIVLR